jgi:RimJ/RimL family protein N-acetyltransferase
MAGVEPLSTCFAQLNLCRLQWTVDAMNVRSRRALMRPRFVREGLLRSYRVRVDLTRADTVVYSVLVDEWPEARTRLQNLIDQRTLNEH